MSLLSTAFEDVVRAVKSLEAHFEGVGESSTLTAVVLELETIEEDFSEIEKTVRGNLNSSPSQSGALSVFRTKPTGQSPNAVCRQELKIKRKLMLNSEKYARQKNKQKSSHSFHFATKTS